MRGPFDALFEDVGVPVAESGFAAQNQDDGWVDEFEGFRPLRGSLGVVFFGRLLDLPGAPGFIAQRPVFDLSVRLAFYSLYN